MTNKQLHILIIPGEELNNNNTYSSVFELHQAIALTSYTSVSCGFISINLQGNLFEKFKSLVRLRISINNFIRFLKNKRINVDRIQSFNCVESISYYVWAGKFKTNYQEQVKLGLRAYETYEKLFGRPDIIHAHSRFLTGGIIAQAIKKKHEIPYLLTEHSSYYARGFVTAKEKNIMQSVINDARYWICVSPQLGNLVTSILPRLNKTFLYLPNVIDKSFENIDPNIEGIKMLPFIFINIASLDENKDQVSLIKAFASKFKNNNNYQLFIGGSGHLESKLKELTIELDVQNQVFFLGKLTREQIIEYLQQAHVFVLSSKYETFGVVLIEALACGKPIVATACGGPENIVHKQNGYLVESNNVESLGNAMFNIVNKYHLFDQTQIKKDCLQRFGTKNIAKQLYQLYQEI